MRAATARRPSCGPRRRCARTRRSPTRSSSSTSWAADRASVRNDDGPPRRCETGRCHFWRALRAEDAELTTAVAVHDHALDTDVAARAEIDAEVRRVAVESALRDDRHAGAI